MVETPQSCAAVMELTEGADGRSERLSQKIREGWRVLFISLRFFTPSTCLPSHAHVADLCHDSLIGQLNVRIHTSSAEVMVSCILSRLPPRALMHEFFPCDRCPFRCQREILPQVLRITTHDNHRELCDCQSAKPSIHSMVHITSQICSIPHVI